jgi:hypothetical protein
MQPRELQTFSLFRTLRFDREVDESPCRFLYFLAKAIRKTIHDSDQTLRLPNNIMYPPKVGFAVFCAQPNESIGT